MVKEILQKQISESFALSILADTTRDKQNIENLPFAIRFVNIEKKLLNDMFQLWLFSRQMRKLYPMQYTLN